MIPALGVYAALRREAGLDLPFPGGAPRVAQAIDADLLARAIAWAGDVASTRNEIFNITNGDVFVWENIWPAIAASLGMRPGGHVPLSLDRDIRPREEEWETICARHGLRSGNLRDFVGLSFEYADYTVGYGRNEPGPPAIVSTIADTGNLPDVRIAPEAAVQSGFRAKLSSTMLRLEGYVTVLSQRWCASRSRSQFLGVFAAAASWYAGRDLVRSR